MRIQRSVSSHVSHVSHRALLAITAIIIALAISIAATIAYQQYISYGASAAPGDPTPEACFATTGTTNKTITNYYANENNDVSQPACPRDVEIPSTIGGGTVVSIGTYGMSSKGLTSVILPPTITHFGVYALAYNQIETVVIPPGVTVLNTGVFRANQLTSVTIHNNMTSIGDRALVDNKLTSIDIPDSVTYIGPRALWDNEFTTVTIPANVDTIASEAFRHNDKLEEVIIEGDPTTISSSAFLNTKISRVVYNGIVYERQTNNVAIDEVCFGFNPSTQAITSYPMYYDNLVNIKNGINCLSEDITIPSAIAGVDVRIIGSSSFYNRLIKNVIIPNSVTTIGSSAFYFNQLTAVTIPNSVTSIGDSAFRSNQLTAVTISSSVTSIGWSAFYLNQLTTVTIPDSVVNIGSWAFSNNQLSSVTIPDSLSVIDSGVFARNRLTTVFIPSSVTDIHPSAFVLQNHWGGEIEKSDSTTGAPYLWSSDPTEVQQVYDSIWYARLYTADPSNPHGLTDGVANEEWYAGYDSNDNGHMNDSLGGHLINPASLDLHYVNQANSNLRTSQTFTGQLLDNTYLHNYYVTQGPEIPAIADTGSPTSEEQEALDQALSVYYRLGDTVTITPPAIDGYVTPPTQTFVLGAGTNEHTITYLTQAEVDAQNNPDAAANDKGTAAADGQLADTGTNTHILAIIALAAIAIGGYGLWRQMTSRKQTS